MHRIINLMPDLIIFKTVPTLTGMFAFIIGGSFLSALLVALIIKVLLYFFEKEIKRFALWLRKKTGL